MPETPHEPSPAPAPPRHRTLLWIVGLCVVVVAGVIALAIFGLSSDNKLPFDYQGFDSK